MPLLKDSAKTKVALTVFLVCCCFFSPVYLNTDQGGKLFRFTYWSLCSVNTLWIEKENYRSV